MYSFHIVAIYSHELMYKCITWPSNWPSDEILLMGIFHMACIIGLHTITSDATILIVGAHVALQNVLQHLSHFLIFYFKIVILLNF